MGAASIKIWRFPRLTRYAQFSPKYLPSVSRQARLFFPSLDSGFRLESPPINSSNLETTPASLKFFLRVKIFAEIIFSRIVLMRVLQIQESVCQFLR
jgi:hypothetical protein